MSLLEEIPAFSVWETINETIAKLMNTKFAEKGDERLAKIMKLGDFLNIFVCNKDLSLSFDEHQRISDKYKSFTTWFLGRFFYLLSCEKLSKSHNVYVDTQLCVLDLLSHTKLHVYDEMANEYCQALNALTKFVRSHQESTTLNLFIPVKYADLSARLNLDPAPIEITQKNWHSFLINLLKFIDHILKQSFEFTSFNPTTSRCLDDLLYLLSECSFDVKTEILQTYLSVATNFDAEDRYHGVVERKLARFASYFEQIAYELYSNKFQVGANAHDTFDSLLLRFLRLHLKTDCFTKLSGFLLLSTTSASEPVKQFCVKHRRRPLYTSEEFQDFMTQALVTYDKSALCGFKQLILRDVAALFEQQNVKLYETKSQWAQFYHLLLVNVDGTDCHPCKIPNFLDFMTELSLILTQIAVEMRQSRTIYFVDDVQVFTKSLRLLNQHFAKCDKTVDFTKIYNFFLNLSFVCRLTLTVGFDLGGHIFTGALITQDHAAPNRELRKETGEFCEFARRLLEDKDVAFAYLNSFVARLSSGLFEQAQVHDVEVAFMTISHQHKNHKTTIKNVASILTLFTNTDRVVSEIITPALASSDEEVLVETTRILPQLICISSSDFTKLIRVDDSWTSEIFCTKCKSGAKCKNSAVVEFARVDLDQSALSGTVLRSVLKFLTYENKELKLAALEALPSCASHILKFYSASAARIWVDKSGDRDEQVRRRFGAVAASVLGHIQSKVLSETNRAEVEDILFGGLSRLAKKSLQYSDSKLQETVLANIHELAGAEGAKTADVARILTYLIMTPTSKQSVIASRKLLHLAERNSCTVTELFKTHKQELCETIAKLCIANQSLAGWSLSTSLSKIATALEFYNAEDFVRRELQHLVPVFVARVIKSPSVSKLIEQLAGMINVSVGHLLAQVYGHIFLNVFLNGSKDDFKACTAYLEKTTGMAQSELCRTNLWVILNELPLHFHDKREKVTFALRYLASGDKDNKTESVQEYLQSRLLGILQYFDFKLMGKNTNTRSILLSLADLLKYMGPTHVGPLRFKLIAMLRTADCGGDFPELVCEVWEAFIKTCDVESLGPQLATIFVSLLPSIKSCPRQINDIFKYLVIDNESHTRDYIKDLFFLDETRIDAKVQQVIKKHVKMLEEASLKDKIRNMLKYLSHETLEVRIRSLKRLKSAIETNREELDRLILGYNGIDAIIVELIEILMRGCREKDAGLRLTCGDVIGELGAVEPSHLPLRYAQNSRNFTFYLTDDAFIVASLNELTRALQGEKNTVNMNRFAVAIQEILKNYDISSDESSARYNLWRQFPESQQEIMEPFLRSKYIVSQLEEIAFRRPIYGSGEGATFQAWIYNWTRSLILTLNTEFQTVLNPCLPAMRQDHRILMQFLPYILLHSVIKDSTDPDEAFEEITAVVDSFTLKKSSAIPQIPDTAPAAVEDKQVQSTRVVFIALDFLDRWTREWQWAKGVSGRANRNYSKLKSFLERFSKLQLARCSSLCGEHPRALMYLEDHISSNPHERLAHLSFLAEIYAQLDEPDGVAGVTASQDTEPPLEQRILTLEVSGKLSDAAACRERMPQPLKLHHVQGLIQCYLDLDNANTALNFAQGALDRQPEHAKMLLEMQAEPLWRLGRYDDLDRLLDDPHLNDNTSWGVQIGKTLLAFRKQDRADFDAVLQSLKMQQVEMLGGASLEEGAYQHGYSYIARLHALNELHQVERATFTILSKPYDDDFVTGVVRNLSKEWELRIKVVQDSVRIVEPLLCLRRVAVEQAKRILQERAPGAVCLLNNLLGDYWLLSARIARDAGGHQQGYTYTLKAEEFAPTTLFLEKSKVYWLREEHDQALTTLRRGLEVLLPDQSKEAVSSLSLEKRKICAEAKLLIARYNDAVSNVDTDIKTANYKEASEMYKEWEVGLVSLAQFYDRRFQNYSDEDRDGVGSDMQIWMITYFCKSLRYGTAFVYQSLPRLLSIWFDYGTRLLEVTQPSIRDERKTNLVKMTKLIDYAAETLPAYVFLTAFSQLVSRICHPQKEVHVELKTIIIKLLLHYPQQTLWMMISVIKSSYRVRANRCAEIFADSKLKTPAMSKLVRDFTSFAEKLIELCNKKLPQDVEVTSISTLLRTLPRLLNKPDFSEIMIPTHKFRKLVLPNPDFSSGQHNPFPNHYVHVVGIDEKVTLLRSLQRPRKITLRGSDGKSYIQMLKPNDDMRKDFRLMEFNDIVNQLLSKESDARQRRLHIRLYSVAPLNEECGLIEWVPDLVALRLVLNGIYKQRGNPMSMREIRDNACNSRDPLSKKKDVFTRVFLARHPPVLGEWFRWTFPDAQSWFFARTSYIRTTAVMSMVGYVLGLGDRHGENILLDSISGDTVHVDFNCLFNKGETFEWPERVPFRLTQNMVSAMGPLGVEGVFRKSCACTLKVLRNNANTLMSIVTPFVYDPLVSWPSTSTNTSAEKTNEKAVDHVKNIQLRLQGIIVKARDKSLSIPLSINGQTNSLINAAINVDNLCQMYIGWAPYL